MSNKSPRVSMPFKLEWFVIVWRSFGASFLVGFEGDHGFESPIQTATGNDQG